MPLLELDSEEACTLAYRLRLQSGMTQAALAGATGFSVSTISRYETGRSTPSRRTLERLAAGAGVSLAALESDLAAQRQRLEALASPARGEAAGRGLAETLRASSLRFFPSELGVDLDAILPLEGRGSATGASRIGGGAGGAVGGLGPFDSLEAGGPAEASAVELGPWLMMRKAVTLHAMGNDRKAAQELSLATLAMSASNPSGPRFVFYLVRIAFLVAAGNAEAAQDLLPSLEEVARGLPPPGEALRLRWMQARVAAARGQNPARQGAALRELEGEFADLEMPLEALCAWADRVALELEERPPGTPRPQDDAPAWAAGDRGAPRSRTEGLELFRSLLASGDATPSAARRFVAFLLCDHIDPGVPFEPRPSLEPEPQDDLDFGY